MSTPVVTNSWAGNFDCSVCRRKRLMAEEFSKKALEKHRKTGGPLKCISCVEAVAAAEREAAAAKKKSTSITTKTNDGTDNENKQRVCAKCQQSLSMDQYNRNQWNKGEGKAKCRPCVEVMIQQEAQQQSQTHAQQYAAAQTQLQQATTPAERIAAESKIAALEAQKVTGLKPVRLSSSSGRGRGGRGRNTFRGSGRGRR